VLLMDEPFSGVDQQSEQEVLDALGLLGQQGITVLLSTHHLKNAALHFDKVLLLKGGLLAAYGAPDTVLTGPNLRAAFGAAWPAWPAATNRLFLNGSALEGQREN